MNFKYSYEQRMVLETVKEFIKVELEPHVETIEATDHMPEGFHQKLGAAGIIGITVPEEFGGLGLSHDCLIVALLELCENSPEVKVVVIEGLKKAFCAGGNLAVFHQDYQEHGRVEQDELLIQAARITSYIRKMGKLVVTSVCGAAAGAGANLAFSGDFVLAAENAKFIQAFVNIGLVPDTGGAFQFCRAEGSHRALELCLRLLGVLS